MKTNEKSFLASCNDDICIAFCRPGMSSTHTDWLHWLAFRIYFMDTEYNDGICFVSLRPFMDTIFNNDIYFSFRNPFMSCLYNDNICFSCHIPFMSSVFNYEICFPFHKPLIGLVYNDEFALPYEDLSWALNTMQHLICVSHTFHDFYSKDRGVICFAFRGPMTFSKCISVKFYQPQAV